MQASTIKTARGRNPLKASQAVRSEFRRRGKRPGNLTFFYGSKVDRDWVLRSSLEFAAVLDAEASQNVTWYSCDPDCIGSELSGAGFRGSKPDLILQRRAGSRTLIEVSYRSDAAHHVRAQQRRVQEANASAVGYAWSCYAEEDALRHQVMLMNWLSISPVLQQHRRLDMGALQTEIADLINARHGATVADVYATFKLQRPHVFVALMRAHQRRLLTVDLGRRPFSLATTVVPWTDP